MNKSPLLAQSRHFPLPYCTTVQLSPNLHGIMPPCSVADVGGLPWVCSSMASG